MTDTASERGEVFITRIFDAPRDLVFACMTEPAHLTHFWGPTRVSTPIENIIVDLRVGGAFETVMVNDDNGEHHRSAGIYTEIIRPSVLAWAEPDGISNHSTFIDLGDGRTEVRIHQTNVPAMFRSPEAQAGMSSSLDRFATYLADLHSTATAP